MPLDPTPELSPLIVCPSTKQPLVLASYEQGLAALGGDAVRLALDAKPAPPTEHVLLRHDNAGFYRVVDGIPILMAPEMLAPAAAATPIDTSVDPYREAYEEMDFYDAWAGREMEDLTASGPYETVRRASEAGEFLQPGWLDAFFDIPSQIDAYRHLAPLDGRRTLQIGGRGIHAVKFLLAGARESWLITPMLGEALFSRELARAFGVEDRFRCAVAIGEELPLVDASFDSVYAGGCIHHTITAQAFPEIARILVDNGRFAALEPWRAPLYGIGTRIFGKREVGVNCRPMDRRRVEPMYRSFGWASVVHHGSLTRYPLIALGKLGIGLGRERVQRIMEIDDRVASLVPGLRDYGSSVALLGTKQAA